MSDYGRIPMRLDIKNIDSKIKEDFTKTVKDMKVSQAFLFEDMWKIYSRYKLIKEMESIIAKRASYGVLAHWTSMFVFPWNKFGEIWDEFSDEVKEKIRLSFEGMLKGIIDDT